MAKRPKDIPLPEFITVEALLDILAALPEGLTELGCRPGEVEDLDTMYGSERAEELKVLCDPQIRATISTLGIKLCTFANLPAEWPRPEALAYRNLCRN